MGVEHAGGRNGRSGQRAQRTGALRAGECRLSGLPGACRTGSGRRVGLMRAFGTAGLSSCSAAGLLTDDASANLKYEALMATRHHPDPNDFSTALEEMVVDANDDDEQLSAMQNAISEALDLPVDAFVLGDPVSLVEVAYDSNARRGLVARVKRVDGSQHELSLADVSVAQTARGAILLGAYRLWLGLEPSGAFVVHDASHARRHSAAEGDIDLSFPVDLVVLNVKQVGARCRLLGSDRGITLRTGDLWRVVPGHIVTVKPNKQWTYARHCYLSGKIESKRIDATALGVTPLTLRDEGPWDPAEEYWREEGEPVEEWAKPLIERGPRPSFKMEQVIPGEDRANFDADPITEANDRIEAGDEPGALDVLRKLLEADLRCLDAHAHLGNIAFRSNPEWAMNHYEVGVSLGELSLGPAFDGVLLWGHMNNRPFLRCMHGLGLCLWRLKRFEEAQDVFTRMLWMNPIDNQGIRFVLPAVQSGKVWVPDES